MTSIIMIFLVFVLASILFTGMRYTIPNDGFFDKENCNALRGFWCLIIVLVHIPVSYQNSIQDSLGSFAYIGVTFFFMTSAYGLELMIEKNSNGLKEFWKRRLPKLILPCLIVNLFEGVVSLIVYSKFISSQRLLHINDWVKWLLICYFIFWLCNRFLVRGARKNICLLIVVFSIVIYYIKIKKYINGTIWSTEIFGFVWGIILAKYKNEIVSYLNKNYKFKILLTCFGACLVGLGYLKFKSIVFWGDYVLKVILGMVIIILMLTFNIRFKLGNKVSNFLGKISYEIYLLQWVIIPLISIYKINNSGIANLLILFITVITGKLIYDIDTIMLKIIERRNRNV